MHQNKSVVCAVWQQQTSSNRNIALAPRAKYNNTAGFDTYDVLTQRHSARGPFSKNTFLFHTTPTHTHSHVQLIQTYHSYDWMPARQTARLGGPPRQAPLCWTTQAVTSNGGSEAGTQEKRGCVRVWHLASHSSDSKQDVGLKIQAVASECAPQWDGEVCAIVSACALVF